MPSSSTFQPGEQSSSPLSVFPEIKPEGCLCGWRRAPFRCSGVDVPVWTRGRERDVLRGPPPAPGRFSRGCWPDPRLAGARLLTSWEPLVRDDGCFKDEDRSLRSQVAAGRLLTGPSHPPCHSSPKFTRAKRIRNEVIIIKRINMPGEKWIINSSCALRPNSTRASIRESRSLNRNERGKVPPAPEPAAGRPLPPRAPAPAAPDDRFSSPN